MTWQMHEKLVENWRAFLAANAGDKLAALEAEYGDGIDLPDFAAVYRGQLRALTAVPKYPVALVMFEDARAADFTSTERGPGQAVLEGTYRIRTGVIVRDADPQVLELKIYRYLRAIVELLSDNEEVSWGTGFDDVGEIRWQVGAGWAPRSGDSILDAAVTHTAQIRELR